MLTQYDWSDLNYALKKDIPHMHVSKELFHDQLENYLLRVDRTSCDFLPTTVCLIFQNVNKTKTDAYEILLSVYKE